MQVLLRADGSAAAVGSNDDGQCAMPDELDHSDGNPNCPVRHTIRIAR